jgi:hypothetical protein
MAGGFCLLGVDGGAETNVSAPQNGSTDYADYTEGFGYFGSDEGGTMPFNRI